jgi:hypothetical protein
MTVENRGNPMTSHSVTSETAAEFYATRLPAPEPAKDETPQGDGKTDAKSESTTPDKPKTKPIQPRINELVAERNSARDQAEAERLEKERLRAELDEMQRQLAALNTPTQTTSNPRPERKNFATDEAYTDALTDWKVDERIAARERSEAEARAKAAQEQVAQNWKARIEAEREDMPDFDDVVGAADTVFPQLVLDAIVDASPRVVYHLAKNPVEARRIAALSAVKAVREIVKLDEELSAARTSAPAAVVEAKGKSSGVEKSRAPEPIEPLKGSAAVGSKDPNEMTPSEFRAWRQAGGGRA